MNKNKETNRIAIHLGLLLFFCTFIGPAMACSVPVGRYALERWLPDAYHLLVVADKPLPAAVETELAALQKKSGKTLNLQINRVSTKEARTVYRRLKLKTIPSAPVLLLLRPLVTEATVIGFSNPAENERPETTRKELLIWSAPLTQSNLRALRESTVCRKLVQKLGQGDLAVWLFVPSGNTKKDSAARTRLKRLLKEEEKSQNALFSILELAPDAPTEHLLLTMLLRTEPDLATFRDRPMAFPVFGRGRVLYSLVGRGINREHVHEASAFLAGPCSCVIKGQNPGVDLMIEADWDQFIKPDDADRSPDEVVLTGVAPTAPDQNTKNVKTSQNPMAASVKKERKAESARLQTAAKVKPTGHSFFIFGSLGALLAVLILVSVIGWIVQKRNGTSL